jgi:hypothetical protein
MKLRFEASAVEAECPGPGANIAYSLLPAAKVIQSSQSRVAKMEAGDPTVSLDLLVRSLLALGASNSELAKIIARR